VVLVVLVLRVLLPPTNVPVLLTNQELPLPNLLRMNNCG
jgi:hypothetical protein